MGVLERAGAAGILVMHIPELVAYLFGRPDHGQEEVKEEAV